MSETIQQETLSMEQIELALRHDCGKMGSHAYYLKACLEAAQRDRTLVVVWRDSDGALRAYIKWEEA